MTNIRILSGTLIWTVIFETITCLLRFGLRLESTRDTASTIGVLTSGLRIHHSYVGVALIPIAMLFEKRWPQIGRNVLMIAMALVLSDLIHHFIVLWYFAGSPQFDLFYVRV
jgi:hypothetical protein